jgi:hypothetical protein
MTIEKKETLSKIADGTTTGPATESTEVHNARERTERTLMPNSGKKADETQADHEVPESFRAIRSESFKSLSPEKQLKTVERAAEAIPHYPQLETEFLECVDAFIMDPRLTLAATKRLGEKNPATLFKVLARHRHFNLILHVNPTISKVIEDAAFSLSGSGYSAQCAHYPFEFALKNTEFIWVNSLIVWIANKAPHHILANAKREDWPESEFKEECIRIATKNLERVNLEILMNLCIDYQEPWAEKAVGLAETQSPEFVLSHADRIKSLPWGKGSLERAARHMAKTDPYYWLTLQGPIGSYLAEFPWAGELTKKAKMTIEKLETK